METNIRHPVLYTLARQALLLPVTALAWYYDRDVAVSLLFGGLIYIVPNAYFTWYAFRYRGAQAAQMIARSFFTGEMGKMFLAACGFALVYRFYASLHAPALVAGFCAMIVLQWYIAWQVATHLRIRGPAQTRV